MDAHYVEFVGLALFVASELLGMSKFKSNSLVQLIITAAIRAFPYEPKRRNTGNPLDIFKR
jgi:hypothetical protein